MKTSAILVLLGLQGIFVMRLVIAEGVSPATLPADGPAAAATRPDVQELRDRATDCRAALARAG